MMKNDRTELPENAYRALEPGEAYRPVLPDTPTPVEASPYAVVTGLLMAVIFSAAAAYLGLRIGQVFEAAIPIAIMAVGIGNLLKKSDTLGQNVIIQSIGSCSGGVVAGAIFTLPALYILGLDARFYQIFLSSLLGGVLGILLLIPFRKYFVKEMHGKYPFPEATATTEVLVTGEGKGGAARLLAVSGLIGGAYDFIVATFGWWSEEISTRVTAWGASIAEQYKIVFKVNTGAAVLGLGYIVGLKYAAIICAGSFMAWFMIVPLIGYLAAEGSAIIPSGELLTAEEIFTGYARHIGIGGIAMAGLIGIVRSSGIIRQAVVLAFGELGGRGSAGRERNRTERDLPMKWILTGLLATLLTCLVFFRFGLLGNLWHSVIAVGIVWIISFLFTTVAANAIAIVGTNPVSGMTLMTLIVTSLILAGMGMTGAEGMTAALIIGGVVCTALAVAGAFISDLKTGYWLGTTPAKQEAWKFVGTFVSAATVAGVMIVLDKTYGFTGEGALAAPQANAMAAVIRPLMEGGATPWMLYFTGAALALLLTMIGVPALAFALGMFIPLELNTPLLVGGLASWYVGRRNTAKGPDRTAGEKGTLIASGFIAGGALMGVVSAVLRYLGADWYSYSWNGRPGSQWVSLLMYGLLVGYLIAASLKKKR